MIGRRLIALGALLGAFAVLAPSADAWIVKEPNGHLISVAVARGVSPASIPGSFAATPAAQGRIGFRQLTTSPSTAGRSCTRSLHT